MSLIADVRLRRGAFSLAVELSVGAAEIVAVVGPNGAGKSTLVRALAGFEAIDEGRITLDGVVLDDPAGGVFVPPRERPSGLVPQDVALFGRLSVVENVAFGLRARGMPRAAARQQAAGWLDRIGLAGRGEERPGELSGGQAQRVGLARTLAVQPRLVLLDEPMAALDAERRAAMRSDLRTLLTGFGGPAVLVTHDVADAAAVADRVAVIEDGRMVRSGRLDEVLADPGTPYLAELARTAGLGRSVASSEPEEGQMGKAEDG